MYVTKTVFGLEELGNCSLDDVRENCIMDFLGKLCDVNKMGEVPETMTDAQRMVSFGKKISFNTDLLKFEMSVTPDEIINENKELIIQENKARNKEVDFRKDPECMNAKPGEEVIPFYLDQQVLDLLLDGSLEIKIFTVGNKDYYCYTI